MKAEYKYCLIGIIAGLLVDALGALTSKHFNFNYTLLLPISLMVYGTTGYHIAKAKNLKSSLLLTSN